MSAAMDPKSGAANFDCRSPAPGRRPWALGEIAAWVVILAMVALFAWRAAAEQRREAAAIEPDISLPMMAQYATGVHALMISAEAARVAEIEASLLGGLDGAARVPEDRLRVALVAGEFRGRDEALQRMAALGTQDKALAEDVRTAQAMYRGEDVPPEAWAAFHEKYQWFADLLAGTGKPAGNPLRARALERAFVTVAVLAGSVFIAGGMGVAGLVLLILALVRLARGRLALAFSRAEAPGADVPADRRTYAYGTAIYLGGFGVVLALRQALGKWGNVSALGIAGMVGAFGLGVIWPLLMGQTWRQWRMTLGLHRGRGIWREIGSGIVGYMAGMPVMAAGVALVAVLVKVSGLKGAHPIVRELQGSRGELALLFFLACVFAPVTEELMFRGALLAHLRERCRWWLAAPVMAVIFALIHPQSWVALPALGAIAVVLAGIREWRGSIIGCMTAHALHNGALLAASALLLG